MKKIIIGAVVLTSIFIGGCNAGKGDPKSVLISFFDALSKKDFTAARKLATAESKNLLDLMEMGMNKEVDKKEDEKYNQTNLNQGEFRN